MEGKHTCLCLKQWSHVLCERKVVTRKRFVGLQGNLRVEAEDDMRLCGGALQRPQEWPLGVWSAQPGERFYDFRGGTNVPVINDDREPTFIQRSEYPAAPTR